MSRTFRPTVPFHVASSRYNRYKLGTQGDLGICCPRFDKDVRRTGNSAWLPKLFFPVPRPFAHATPGRPGWNSVVADDRSAVLARLVETADVETTHD